MSSLDKQIGGDHYGQGAIQPIEFIVANDIPFIEGNIVKYVVRHAHKNGKQDLEKARHYLDMLIELAYSEPDPVPDEKPEIFVTKPSPALVGVTQTTEGDSE